MVSKLRSNSNKDSPNDENVGRPRRSTANRSTIIESGTDDESGSSSRRKRSKLPKNKNHLKRKKKENKPAAKRPRRDTDSSDSDDETYMGMKNFTEKEKELQIFKRLEHQELLKTKEEIRLSIFGAVEEPIKESNGKSPSDDDTLRNKSSTQIAVKNESEDEKLEIKAESQLDLDDENHRLSKEKAEKEIPSSSEPNASHVEELCKVAEILKPLQNEVNNFEQLNRILLSRSKLAKLCHAPFFDETVLGCFVRISIGQSNGIAVYRAVQVIGVVEGQKTYNIENTRTNKAIHLKHGPDERVYSMEFCSNQNITDIEFSNWKNSMKIAKLPLPTTDYIEKKYHDIVAALNFQYSDEDVKKMVQQRQKFMTAPTKAQLLKMKLDADLNGDFVKSKELQMQIDKMNGLLEKKVTIQSRNLVR